MGSYIDAVVAALIVAIGVNVAADKIVEAIRLLRVAIEWKEGSSR